MGKNTFPMPASFLDPIWMRTWGWDLSWDSGALVRGIRKQDRSLSRGEEIGIHLNDRERIGFIW